MDLSFEIPNLQSIFVCVPYKYMKILVLYISIVFLMWNFKVFFVKLNNFLCYTII